MKVVRHIVKYVIFCCLFSPALQAQGLRFDKDVVSAFQLYFTFTNQTTHKVNMYASDFFKINQMLIDSNLYKPADFVKEDPFQYIDVFPQKTKYVYEQLIIHNAFLPFEKRGKSLLLVGKINEVCSEIAKNRSEIIQFLQSRTYTDSLYNDVVRKLQRVEVLYYDLHTLHKKLIWELQGMHQLFTVKIAKQTHLYLDIFDQLYKIIDQHLTALRSHGHLNSIRTEHQEIQNKLMILSKLIKAQENTQDQYLVRIKERILQKMDKLYSALNAKLLLNDKVKESIHWHNQAFLTQLNRTDKGLVELMNDFIKKYSPNILQKLEFPVYYKAPPLKGIEDDLSPINVDSFFNALNLKKPIDTIKPEKVQKEKYVASHLIYLVDVSSSMNAPEKLPVIKKALKYMTGRLSDDNLITIITYSKKANVLLAPTQSTESTLINEAIDRLFFGSKSNIHLGLQMAYQIANEYFIEDGDNQIFLATDGDIEIAKNEKQILQKQKRKNGIQFHALYVSEKVYSHHKSNLSKLTDIGGGSFIHLDKTNFQEQIMSPLRKKER